MNFPTEIFKTTNTIELVNCQAESEQGLSIFPLIYNCLYCQQPVSDLAGINEHPHSAVRESF